MIPLPPPLPGGQAQLPEAWPGSSSLSCSLSSAAGPGTLVPVMLPLCKGGWEARLVWQHVPFSHLRVFNCIFDYVLFYLNI